MAQIDAARSRFAGWPGWAAATSLALLALLMIGGAMRAPPVIDAAHVTAATQADAGADARLYARIVQGLRDGGDYYPVAAEALREEDFPLRPFLAFRLPTLATILAALPDPLPSALIGVLIIAVVAAWTVRIGAVFHRPMVQAGCGLLVLAGVIAAAQPVMVLFHEVWAGLLIALSLALRRDNRWGASLAIGLCAVMIRETAIAYVLAMAVLAMAGGKRREALGWAGAIGLFALLILWHAGQVSAVTSAADPASAGWSGLGGWPFFLAAMRTTTPLTLLPAALSAILLPLALLGWIGWRSPLALRTAATLTGYAMMLMLFARPDNFYWGLLLSPLILLGLAFVPAALGDLVAALRPRALDSGSPTRQ